ncbi:MAG: fasciclin domain-containing protein [Planctomycetota bacterium]
MTKSLAAAAIAALIAGPAFAGNCPASQHQAEQSQYHETTYTVSHHNEGEDEKDIVDTAASLEDFSTLVAAVKAAGLVDALKGDGPFTVFAPTNDAFAKLPEGKVEELLKPENKQQLTDILLYHVVPGKVLASDVVQIESADTLLKDKKVSVKVEDGKVYIDNAQVVKTDVEVSNGVIHVIDSVILP